MGGVDTECGRQIALEEGATPAAPSLQEPRHRCGFDNITFGKENEKKSTEAALAVKGTTREANQLEHQRVIENLRTQ